MSDKTPIQFPPGVFRQGSEAEMEGKWYMTQLVRWINGVLRPVGGWERIIPQGEVEIEGTIRATHVWITRDGIQRTALLTETNLYVMTTNGEVIDITPSPAITPPDTTSAGGYGDFTYNYSTYGTPRPDRPDTLTIGPMWTLDNFGDDLVAMASSDGRLLRWDPGGAPGTVAVEVTEAPHGRFFVVTAERSIMIFWIESAFNSFGWCAQEDLTDWDYADVESTAGSYDIEPASPFITAVQTRYGVLAFTAIGAYFIRYMGVPYIYSYEYLGYFGAPVAGGAIQQTADLVMWYSTDGFWSFDGQTIAAVDCPLLDWMQRVIDPLWQYRRMVAIYIGVQSEVWFFFPELGQTENNRYVVVNYDEKWWSMGKLSRTCGTAGSALSYPIMSDGINVFLHEKGLFYYDAPELPYAQSGAIQMGGGARKMTMRKGIVDTRAPAEDVVFTFKARQDRISNGTEVKPERVRNVRPNGGKLDFRITGRDVTVRIASTRSGAEPWTFGRMLVHMFPRGGR